MEKVKVGVRSREVTNEPEPLSKPTLPKLES